MRQITLGPFGGLVSSVDPGSIPDHCAQDLLNVRVENGQCRLRYSYRQMAAAPGATACYGLSHLLGYNGSYAQVEEFATVATIGGNTRPYSVHPTTGAMTEIKNGVSSVTMHASDWTMVPFDQTSYWINTNNTNPVLKHTIGDATSMSVITNAVQSPSDPLVYAIQYSASGSSASAYDQQTWAGITAATAITNASANVSAASSATEGDSIKVAITSSSTAPTPFNFDITHLASKDYQYNDLFIFQFSVSTVGVTNWEDQNELFPTNSLKVSFYNGSTYLGSSTQWDRTLENNQWVYFALVSLENVTRSSRSAITRVKVEGSLQCKSALFPLTYLYCRPYTVGMVNCASSAVPTAGRKFAYSYINTAQNDETELFGTGTASDPWVSINNATLRGFSPHTRRPTWYLGTWVKKTIVASSDASVDKDRLYVADASSWRRFDEIADGGTSPTTATTYFRYTAQEVQAFPIRTANQPGPFPNMKCACPHKGWMIWGRKGGARNIVHSGIGEPERLPSSADLLTDDTRGGEYSLGDNFGDEPVAIFSGGDAVIIFGKQGVYTQFGDRPHSMTPPKRVAGSKGILNQFAASRFRDDSGNPGVAFATRDGIYFIAFDQAFEGDDSSKLTELSGDVRNRLGLDALIPVSSTVRLVSDENQDSLWVMWSNKAYVLRRPSLIDGIRRWEYYEYRMFSGDTSLKYTVAPVQYGLRSLTDVAHFLELEFDSANNVYMGAASYLFYEGTTGPPALESFPEYYWRSKDFVEANRRVIYIQLDPVTTVSPNGGAPQIEVMGAERSGGTTTQALAQGSASRTIRFGPLVQGRGLSYKLNTTDPTVGDIEPYVFGTVNVFESGPLSPRRTV